MADKAQDDDALLLAMREAFLDRDFERTLAVFQQLTGMGRKPVRNIRVEATSLAARALTARQERSAARSLLRALLASDYTKTIHYDFLAHAFLDLRMYSDAARMCSRAAELQQSETQKPSEDGP